MHRKLVYDFGSTIEVEENYPSNYGAPGKGRLKKIKATPEQIKAQNRKNKEKRIRRKIKANFREEDIWLTLTYRKEERPESMKEATKDIRAFLDKLRRAYKKQGVPLKWMLHTEIGSRGGIHHHLIINRVTDSDLIIRRAWKKGGAHMDLLYEEGGFRKLAAYLAKEPDSENKLQESRFSCSRNLKKPKLKKYLLKCWAKEPKPRKGYYIDKETYHEGVNPITGRRYRSYTMIRLNRRI